MGLFSKIKNNVDGFIGLRADHLAFKYVKGNPLPYSVVFKSGLHKRMFLKWDTFDHYRVGVSLSYDDDMKHDLRSSDLGFCATLYIIDTAPKQWKYLAPIRFVFRNRDCDTPNVIVARILEDIASNKMPYSPLIGSGSFDRPTHVSPFLALINAMINGLWCDIARECYIHIENIDEDGSLKLISHGHYPVLIRFKGNLADLDASATRVHVRDLFDTYTYVLSFLNGMSNTKNNELNKHNLKSLLEDIRKLIFDALEYIDSKKKPNHEDKYEGFTYVSDYTRSKLNNYFGDECDDWRIDSEI